MHDVLVIYHSQEHGNTEALAKLIAQGILEGDGTQVTMINTNEAQRVDMDRLTRCDGLAIGSPDYYSYVAGTIKQLFDDIYVARTQQGMDFSEIPCVLFMTHGGGGRAIAPFRQLGKQLNVVAEPYACQRTPPQGCPEAVELGRALRRAIGPRQG